MADAAVRVDIIVGQNTVVKSTELTEAALGRLMGTAAKTNTAFAGLSTGGLKRLESGFQALAFSAAGVPGPMGKIASGAILLGGGSGVLLGVAAAAGAVALAWQFMSREGEKLKTLLKDLNDLLPKNDPAATKVAEGWKQYGDMLRRANELEAKANRPGAMFSSASLLADAAALREKAAALKALLDSAGLTATTMGGGDKPGAAAKGGKSWDGTLGDWMPEVVAPKELPIAIRGNISEPLTEATAVWQEYNAEVADGIAKQQEMFDTVNLMGGAFETLAEGLGAAIAGYGSFARVMIQAASQAISAIAKMHAKQELAAAAESFAIGAWPPNAAAIAAGVKHLKAAALWNIVAGAAGVAGSVGAGLVGQGSAGGGVESGRFQQDQREMAARGTVTVRLGDRGFIDPKSPVFQEWLAQVIKEAKGRNVVFA